MVTRHSKFSIFIHWFNAFCWILLLFTGFAILANPDTQPIGLWWSKGWKTITNGSANLLLFHICLAIIWICIYALYIVLTLRKEVIPFLKEIFNISIIQDLDWCIRKGIWLVTSEKTMKKLGINPELHPQGFYNAGQKLVAVAAILCSLGLVVTGIFLTLAYFGYLATSYLQWILLIHLFCAGIMAIALPIHIYMAAFAPGETPALKSMFTGKITLEHIKHHNPLWYQELTKKEN